MKQHLQIDGLADLCKNSNLKNWIISVEQLINSKFDVKRHGDLNRWEEIFKELPKVKSEIYDLNSRYITVGSPEEMSEADRELMKKLFLEMTPWRKGPYDLFGMKIDSEWRSDLKWERLKDNLSPLKNRTILDVGTGNGYHLWRMAGEGAKNVIGIDPYMRSVIQFMLIKKFLPLPNVNLLPLGVEELPENLQAFDTVFSMGVLYHRKSPIEHLQQLKSLLQKGGELVLETLIVEGEEGFSLLPDDRYARMGNVWFIPSVPTLKQWMKRVGFSNIKCVDVTATTSEEQRVTEWIMFKSLEDFLDPNDKTKTVEGYPAPVRAIMVAEK